MSKLAVTIIGQDIFDPVRGIGNDLKLNLVNPISQGTLGNLKTLTVVYDIPDDKIIDKRKEFMHRLAEDRSLLFPMYLHGDWMRVFVFKSLAFKTRS